MNRRLVLGVIAVCLLVGLAGCSMFFGDISDEELDQDQEYDDLRDSDADVAIDIESGGLFSSGEFRAVYDLEEREEIALYRSNIHADEPLDIRAVRYWDSDGTEITGSELEVDQGQEHTVVTLPDENGTLAFTGDAGRHTFDLPAYVEGSYEVTLPPGYRSSAFLFGEVTPGGYERDVVDDQEHLTWEEVDSTLALQYYQTRDIPIFLGLVTVVSVIGGIGIAYYYRKVKRLKEQREELGLDIDIDDDDNDGPPPGMR
ncbi:DUF5803 family protein [Natronorubrum daqingense]|uniref:Uncharacterized protein n=1 Tax=Natronorubrum daqingense TaxID=588898 RepID=A0A1N6Z4P6_9EURY|nr:DUF5803 family protein [Natronorubrum daqingense]APX95461.1 hypothetical protein BB347_01875 [Natronorubrum daqingense]SIR21832.1 hypothetical protein SAMN05421809_0679 [Natronorubrum daqingense]